MGLTVALDERAGVSWAMDPKTGNSTRSKTRDADKEIEVCAQCHARRAQIAEGYHAGNAFLDHYVPALLTPPLYYADGQQREEVYNWGSFLQSKMYRRGVTCSDCHDPHTQKLKADGNALCAQCHSAEKYDAKTHHFHTAGSAGAQCVNCHMPAANFMVIDARRDHSLRVPRPDQSVALGVPNACNNCHDQERCGMGRRRRAPVVRTRRAGIAEFRLRRSTTPKWASPARARRSPPSRRTQVSPPLLAQSALDRMQATPTSGAADGGAQRRTQHQSTDSPRRSETREHRSRQPTASPSPDHCSRIRFVLSGSKPSTRWSMSLWCSCPRNSGSRGNAPPTNMSLRRSTTPIGPKSRTNLGTFNARLGKFDAAQAEFAAARKLAPQYIPAYVNGADAFRQQGREADAIRTLKEGIAVVPLNGTLHHVLGLAYAREQQREAALVEFTRAVQLAPDNARYTYVYAIALNSLGRSAEATRTLQRAAERWPADRNILFALAALERDAGHLDEARKAAQKLVADDPDDREARSLLEQLASKERLQASASSPACTMSAARCSARSLLSVSCHSPSGEESWTMPPPACA